VDDVEGTSAETHPHFSMSGDGKQDIVIPVVFLYRKEGTRLIELIKQHGQLNITISNKNPAEMSVHNSNSEHAHNKKSDQSSALNKQSTSTTSDSAKGDSSTAASENEPDLKPLEQNLGQLVSNLADVLKLPDFLSDIEFAE